MTKFAACMVAPVKLCSEHSNGASGDCDEVGVSFNCLSPSFEKGTDSSLVNGYCTFSQ